MRALVACVALGLAVGASAARAQDGQAILLVKAADVHEWLARGAAATLVDVRTPEEYRARHIKGAVSIPLDEIPARASEIPRQGLVVLY